MKTLMRVLGFTALAAVYPTVVEYAVKGALSFGALWDPSFVLGWYQFNNDAILSIPVIGDRALALLLTWFAPGDLVYWEVWFLLVIPISLIAWMLRKIFGPSRATETRGAA